MASHKTSAPSLFSLLFLCLMSLSGYFLHEAPVMGITPAWDEEHGHWKVAGAEPASPFKEGDVIRKVGSLDVGLHHLLLDNIYIGSRDELFRWFEAKRLYYDELSGKEVRFVVERNGTKTELLVTIQKNGFEFLKRIEILHIFVGTAFFAIGMLVLYRKGAPGQGGVFALMCMSMMFVYITNATSLLSETVYEPDYLAVMNMINIANFFLAPVLLLHFSLLIPVKRRLLERLPWLPWLLYPFCAAAIVSMQIPVINIAVPTAFLLSVVAIIHAFVAYRLPVQRQRMKWVAAGFVFGLFPWIAVNGLPLLITGERLMNDTIPGSFLVFVPICMAVAITRYNLMDIDTLFDNTIIYTMTLGALLFADLGAMGLFARIQGEAFTVAEPVSAALALWLAVLAYVPLRNRVRRGVKKLLKREIYDIAEVSVSFSAQLASATGVDEIIDRTRGVIDETLHPKGIEVVMPEADRPVGLRGLPVDGDMLGGIGRITRIYPAGVEDDTAGEYSEGLIVPLLVSDRPLGWLVLRNKHSGRPYNGDDFMLLCAISRQAALAIDGMNHRATALKKDAEAAHEKERIWREIHDGIGSGITKAILMLDLADREISLTGQKGSAHLVNLKEQLHEGLMELRDMVWAEAGEESTVDDLAAYLDEKVRRIEGVRHEVAIRMDDKNLRISPQTRLNLVRIVQECLANVIRHAGASKIFVDFTVSAGRLVLKIADDGTGFDPSARPRRGNGLRNMQRRCEEMKAECRVYSEPGRGTSVEVQMALATASPRDLTRIFS